MMVGDNFLRFLSAKKTSKLASSDSKLHDLYDERHRIATARTASPIILLEGECSTDKVYELMRTSDKGYLYLQYPSSVKVDSFDSNWGIGENFGQQAVNPKGAQSTWLDPESGGSMTASEEHDLSDGRPLHTAYFHSIAISGRPDGPTLVKVETSRVELTGDGEVIIAAPEEPVEARRAMLACPAFAISNGDDGLAGRQRQLHPGISLPLGILSWLMTSALMHCEDACLGAYNLLLSVCCKIWYIVPPGKSAEFLQYIRKTIGNGVGLSYIKQLLPFIPESVMAELGIERFVQRPGQSIITLPGTVFHYTISTGTSEAEATNFHLDMPGRHFLDEWRLWRQYARMCARVCINVRGMSAVS